VLFYSDGDFRTWRKLQGDLPPAAFENAMAVLAGMESYCIGATCRHRALVRYFGQDLEGDSCNACDVCLSEIDLVEDSLIVAQKILSCVVRLEERFGGDYTALVLSGSKDQRILDNGHDRLSTWSILSDHSRKVIRGWIEQLVGQGHLAKTGEYRVLRVTPAGRQVLRGEITPRLLRPAKRAEKQKTSKAAKVSWEGVDRGLFEALRIYRRRKAEERGVPPFIIFSDATLRELARYRPTLLGGLLEVHGLGEKKCAEYGAEVLDEIARYCERVGLTADVDAHGRR
jgi:ATP-dependent DNA helicase RecQ